MTRAKVPACGRAGCTDLTRHTHTGPVWVGDRVVGVPHTIGAPGWTFTNARGEIVAAPATFRRIVKLDGTGELRDVHVDNLRREKTWKPPKPAKQKMIGAKRPGIDEKYGVELSLLGDVE